jgi:eukaryotic-like serine/threonine-protein kinase
MPDDDLKTIAEARVGHVLRGKYRLDRVLGIGGMATVYAATHRNKKRVAIKMLHPELSIRENIRARFLREGYVANSVDHPGAVSVHDDDVAEDGSAFLVMELLEGSSVDDVVSSAPGQRLGVGLVLAIGDALLDVLIAAHGKGVIHRDLKPANLFLTNDGRLEVLDFGIARLHDETGGEATAAGAVMGTAAYMAPEQALGESGKIDAQTDLWAVGATLFVVASGTLVHEGVNAQQLVVAAATKKARSLASVADEVPAAVVEVIDRALAFEKGDRWASAKEMREALRKACVDSTGAPVPPLPKTERVTGLEDTIAPDVASSSGSSGDAFEPTIAAMGAGAAPSLGTGPAVSASRSDEPRGARRSRGTFMRLGIATLACATAAGGIVAYRAVHAPRVRYCLALEQTSDGPRCAFEVGPNVLARTRGARPRVTEVGGHVVTVEHVNFAGLPFPGSPDGYDEEPLRWDIVRDDRGAVREIIKRDRQGVIQSWEKWSEGGTRIDLVDLDGTSPKHGSLTDRYTTLRIDYDEQRRRRRVRFFGPTGRPRTGSGSGLSSTDLTYGYECEYGKTSATAPAPCIRRVFLAADGKPGATPSGRASITSSDDGAPTPSDDGTLIGQDQWMFDVERRAYAADGVWHVHHAYDGVDETGWAFFGLHDEPVVFLGESEHKCNNDWDPVSHTFTAACVDEKGKPTRLRGSWFFVLKVSFDPRGRKVFKETLDAQGNRVIRKDDAAAHRYSYDARDFLAVDDFLDASGKPMTGGLGCARIVTTRDDRGWIQEVRCFDPAGNPTPSHDFGAIERRTHDERGVQVGWSDFDAKEQPLADETGRASERVKLDRMRNTVEKVFLGVDEKPVVGTRGYATERSTFDDNDDLVGVAYFDANGQPTMYKGEYAATHLKNDERGLVIEKSYTDGLGEPVLCRDGYASVKRTRDRNGDITLEEFFGKRSEPVLREGGYAAIATTYDIYRRTVATTLFDASRRPVVGTHGWSTERTGYDERGLVVRVDHLDTAKTPALDDSGRASFTRSYDVRGNLTVETNLGVDGAPVDAILGYATKTSSYDDRDELIEESLLHADGTQAVGKEGWSLRRVRHDDFGDVIEEAFLDAAHRPVIPKSLTYASKQQRFDARRHLVEVAYLDVNGAPTTGPEGSAIVRYERDVYGNSTRTSFFDGAGAPTASKDGTFVVHATYDGAGRLLEERFLDASSAPRAAKDGCAGHATKYDTQGRKTEESCLGLTNGAAVSADGWAFRRTMHDARGNDVDVSTYGQDGSLHADKEGVARRKSIYDARNLLLETTFADVADRATHNARGAYAVRYSYDDAGKKVGEIAVDQKGQPMKASR